MSPIAVICAADDQYALPLSVMLQSLHSHANTDRQLDVYVIDCGLSASTISQIEQQAGQNLLVHWRPSCRPSDIGDPLWGHVSGATYERLLIDEYLPKDLTRALWIDCDVLILADIGDLFDQPLSGHFVGAVRDPFIPLVSSTFGVHNWRELGLLKDNPYFNAGVMLIDMDLWRDLDIASHTLQYLRKYQKKVFFNDQEALNAVIPEDWVALDDHWNISANRFHAKQQVMFTAGPSIIHFAGRVKPWEIPDLGAQQDLYFRQLDKTPWKGVRPRATVWKRILSKYLRSDLRKLTYSLENLHLRLRHFLGI